MEAIFLGVGEAFDKDLRNTSILIKDEKTSIMLDCGFTAPNALWNYSDNASIPKAVWISHQHGDHFGGIASLRGYMFVKQRKKPLKIICSEELKDPIMRNIRDLYPEIVDKDPAVEFMIAEEGVQTKLNQLTLDFAPTEHYRPNLAVRVSNGRTSVCYSGDGRITEASRELYRGADLLIHEGYKLYEDEMHSREREGHQSIDTLVSEAKDIGVKRLGIVHIATSEREKRKKLDEIKEFVKTCGIEAFVATPREQFIWEYASV